MKFGWIVFAGLVGCSTDVGTTRGELDQLDFEISGHDGPGDHCFISCAVDHPLMIGTTEEINVATPGLTTFMHGRSSDERVLAVEDQVGTCCDHGCTLGDTYDQCLAEGKEASYFTSFNITGIGDGSAYLELLTPANEVYEKLRLAVHPAYSVELEVHDRSHNTLDISTVDTLELSGKHVDVKAIVRDRAGDWMFVSRGVTMEIRDPNVAAFDGEKAAIESQRAEVWPLARGTDMMVLRAGDANRDVPVVSR